MAIRVRAYGLLRVTIPLTLTLSPTGREPAVLAAIA
jgi:hypothetical protein